MANLLCAPLKVGDQLIGVLELINKRSKFSNDDFPFLEQIAKQLSIGLASYRLKELSNNIISNRVIESSETSLVDPMQASIFKSIKAQLDCQGVIFYKYDDSIKDFC